MTIRFVNTADAAAMLDIYAPFITNTTTSFEMVVPTVDEFASRVAASMQKHPWLVAEVNGVLAGYAYAGKHRERQAYQWCVETSVYVHPAFYKQGIARLLYTKLFSVLKTQGFVNAYAGIALPNAASVQLHRALGFEDIGVYQKIGFKFGAWHDVLWMVKHINEHQPNMPEPKTMESVLHLLE